MPQRTLVSAPAKSTRTQVVCSILLLCIACGDESSIDGNDAGLGDTALSPDSINMLDGSTPMEDGGSADVSVADDSSVPDASTADAEGEPWRDPTLTTDPEARSRSTSYEEQLWAHRDDLEFQLFDQFGDGRWTDSAAQEATYSSGWGLAAYHTMDEIIELTHLMETTDDESHRLHYADMAFRALEILIPAMVEGRGTETGCATSAPRYECSVGHFRYLDNGHGTGAAGFVMNAFYENPTLRAMYADDLERWARALVPILERHKSDWTESTEASGVPHMPAKIGAGYLAVSKILDRPEYLDGFTNIVRVLAASAESNSPAGWIGSDASHARISIVVMHLAFREQLRGVLPSIVSPAHFTGVGDTLEAARIARPRRECFVGSLVGHFGVVARFSSDVRDLTDVTYSLDEVSPGRHAWGCPAETIAALAMGYATPLSSDDAR